ncbi:bifunctional pyr operon transcriptional regulator/uracil phosphoribosyltransferase PyrR [Lapillicoccus jejuensis]|uniref:Bifunctional protein PyrR n=1 Tax=Lapillicoccus jejuensis TaxID=402171 RepID=A0A542E6G5_9MICO|nr:bifunctional pyr operon transcriptional regulator/uracil phosphoribosyltransferase PyrR [Lapillicoccus jejuensis]TQJ10932.1 pyrimidine operon attenuation protein/uracil phosphoribosyltransferase [Lapillicoccus jejuensis]
MSAAAQPSSARPENPGPSPVPADARAVMASSDVSRALRRIAHEILEGNRGTDGLVVMGIPSRGVQLARRLGAVIEEVEGTSVPIGSLDVTMQRDDLRRQPVRPVARTQVPPGGVDGKVVVLVDDVLYSGRTIRAALEALAELGRPRIVRLAVLVDRGHRELPIRADHVGKNLPTSSSERVHVRLAEVDGEEDSVKISGGKTTDATGEEA